MENLHFYSQFIFIPLLYVVNNNYFSTKNLAVHNNNITSANNFHLPLTDLIKYQKAFHYAEIKNFNHLPTRIKCVANGIHIVKLALKGFLFSNLFCSLEEYFNSHK